MGLTGGAWAGEVVSENGPWVDDTVSRTLDAAGRMTGLTVQGPAGQAFSVGYGHTSGRLQSVSGPAGTFSYGYLAPVVGGKGVSPHS